LRAEELVVAAHAQLHGRNALHAEVAHQRRHQRQFANAALDGEGRLQHHADEVVLLADLLAGERFHLDGVVGLDPRMAESHDSCFLVEQFGDAALADAVADGLDDPPIAHIDGGMADWRHGQQADSHGTDAVARGQDDVSGLQALRIDGQAAVAWVERNTLHDQLRPARGGSGIDVCGTARKGRGQRKHRKVA
jgi:hypothetical protein